MGQEEPSGPREQHCAETQGWVVAGVQSLSRVWVCDPMDYSMPGFPVLHYLPELSQWYHPTISSSVTLFSYLQSSLASGSFPVSWLLASGGQSIGASTSVLPMNIRGWFPLGLTGLVSLQSKGLSRVFFSTTVWKCQFFDTQPSLWSNSHPYMTTGKIIALTRRTFVGKVMCLLFNIWENETNVSCQKARQPEGGAGRERWSWRDGRGC